jgi:Na+/melibiose symporter-like transporter
MQLLIWILKLPKKRVKTLWIKIFAGTGWAGYDPNPGVDVIIGLRLLMFVFPAIALVIAILFFWSYELHGETLEKMREELAKHPELK